ncbi:hypothetical protein EVAR_93310_1 [Eumeta japonica]|uniref:Uncharacterized protein n=1 Tax=Eumeta variegata TaxID=151549 RepID=A0A4C1USR3_EUMVA|nr:hypothetical protein EVAR_93310_1 [Eumeta japonica]
MTHHRKPLSITGLLAKSAARGRLLHERLDASDGADAICVTYMVDGVCTTYIYEQVSRANKCAGARSHVTAADTPGVAPVNHSISKCPPRASPPRLKLSKARNCFVQSRTVIGGAESKRNREAEPAPKSRTVLGSRPRVGPGLEPIA